MIRVAGVMEKDIDLLLLEEFVASQNFCNFFLSAVGKSDCKFNLIRARRSVTDSQGESDLELVFENDAQTFILMLENKVKASFQNDQDRRYKSRGEKYLATGVADEFSTILVAPSAYFNGQVKGFDCRVNYEDIVDWYRYSEVSEKRKEYKIYLLESAIGKSSTGYQFEEDSAVSSFWMEYWLLASEIAKDLRMPKPTPKPSSSTFINFAPVGFEKKHKLIHKFTHGNVDIQISDMGDYTQDLHNKIVDRLDPDMNVVKAAKSAAIRISMPKITLGKSFNEQKETAIQGIENAVRLNRWYAENKRLLK